MLCGGTTSTAALQSIASIGTSGQVLTSNGAGALPTFQAAGAAWPPLGDTSGGDAPAGHIGEYTELYRGSPGLGIAINAHSFVDAVNLSNGEWEVTINANVSLLATTSGVASVYFSLSQSATPGTNQMINSGWIDAGNTRYSSTTIGPIRIKVPAGGQTWGWEAYPQAVGGVVIGAAYGYGLVRARRVR